MAPFFEKPALSSVNCSALICPYISEYISRLSSLLCGSVWCHHCHNVKVSLNYTVLDIQFCSYSYMFWLFEVMCISMWIFKNLLIYFWVHSAAGRILVPRPGIEPALAAVKAQHPNHWTTREFLHVNLIYFLFCSNFSVYWNVIASQCCVSFCPTAWISHMYTDAPSPLDPPSHPPTPLGSSQSSTEPPLCCGAAPCRLALHTRACVCQRSALPLPPLLPLPLRPQSLLCLRLSLPCEQRSNAIFLDSLYMH